MGIENVTSEDLDYLQRLGSEPPLVLDGAPLTEAPAALRRLRRIKGIGRFERPSGVSSDSFRLVTEDTLVALYNYKVPMAFSVGGRPGHTLVRMGTWLPDGLSADALSQNDNIMQTSLRTLYPSISVVEEEDEPQQWPLGGLVLGIPTAKPPDVDCDGLPLDRLVRALTGASWRALVLAQPVEETAISDFRFRLINEIRSVATAAQAGETPSPLTEYYAALLGDWVKELTRGQAIGMWRTAVYLLGDDQSYYRLASAWRGVFAGTRSLPEPVRIWDRPDVPMLAARWAMPEPVSSPAPGLFQRLFSHQTLLTSTQLAAYVHLPQFETTGFEIRTVPSFDVVPPKPKSDQVVNLGAVLDRGSATGSDFTFDVERFTRHAFVTGVTGSGKTNTVFNVLREAASAGLPFLVIEPAKTEYRALLNDGDAVQNLQVFTLGDEMVSPFRLNPFEVPDGIPVAVHLDLLRSVFTVSFGMWTPLPQVIEICLHRVYADRGWDITSNSNRRLDETSDRSASFPTLTDLVAKVELVSNELGYEQRVSADIRAALRTRLNSLRAGGKGRMLDTSASVPVDLLLGRPTVLELEHLGDDDDKAFVMGLVLIRLAEHRRVGRDTDQLQHLLVIEEAHRLLGRAGGARDRAEADVRGKAVETFTNLLSEIRAYGQGAVVVDQVPTKLAPDVVKNTNLKVAHRIVAGDDRAVLGAAMAMDTRQEEVLATLSLGQAAVFVDGEDAPLLLQVPRAKGGAKTWPSDDIVRQSMSARAELRALPRLYLPSSDCDMSCLEHPDSCELARRLLEEDEIQRAFARIVLSTILSPGGLRRTWPELVELVEARRPPWIETKVLLRSMLVHGPAVLAARRGADAGWTYADTRALGSAIRLALESESEGRKGDDSVQALRSLFLRLQPERHGPFLGCTRIWGDSDGPCLCRYPVAELVASRAFDRSWTQATHADRASKSGGGPAVWNVCRDAAYYLVEFPRNREESDVIDAARCVALCFGQQMLATRTWSHPRSQRRVLDGLMEIAGQADAARTEKTVTGLVDAPS